MEQRSTMTPKQLERKAKQLYSRKKVIETVDELEEAIRTFMALQDKTTIYTEKFTIRLMDGTLDISVRPYIHMNQFTLNFSKSQREGGHYK
jgi:hypothetical protein